MIKLTNAATMTAKCVQALGPDYSIDVQCEWDKTSDTKVEASKMGEDSVRGSADREASKFHGGSEDSSVSVEARGPAGPR